MFLPSCQHCQNFTHVRAPMILAVYFLFSGESWLSYQSKSLFSVSFRNVLKAPSSWFYQDLQPLKAWTAPVTDILKVYLRQRLRKQFSGWGWEPDSPELMKKPGVVACTCHLVLGKQKQEDPWSLASFSIYKLTENLSRNHKGSSDTQADF